MRDQQSYSFRLGGSPFPYSAAMAQVPDLRRFLRCSCLVLWLWVGLLTCLAVLRPPAATEVMAALPSLPWPPGPNARLMHILPMMMGWPDAAALARHVFLLGLAVFALHFAVGVVALRRAGVAIGQAWAAAARGPDGRMRD